MRQCAEGLRRSVAATPGDVLCRRHRATRIASSPTARASGRSSRSWRQRESCDACPNRERHSGGPPNELERHRRSAQRAQHPGGCGSPALVCDPGAASAGAVGGVRSSPRWRSLSPLAALRHDARRLRKFLRQAPRFVPCQQRRYVAPPVKVSQGSTVCVLYNEFAGGFGCTPGSRKTRQHTCGVHFCLLSNVFKVSRQIWEL
jgi:hypothetical protein